jgi:hypothetical protein
MGNSFIQIVGVGETVGLTVALTVGDTVGDIVGLTVGDTVGEIVGDKVGDTVGLTVGDAVGVAETVGVGDEVGGGGATWTESPCHVAFIAPAEILYRWQLDSLKLSSLTSHADPITWNFIVEKYPEPETPELPLMSFCILTMPGPLGKL